MLTLAVLGQFIGLIVIKKIVTLSSEGYHVTNNQLT